MASNATTIWCPKCQKRYRVPENADKKTLRCKMCKFAFLIGDALKVDPELAKQNIEDVIVPATIVSMPKKSQPNTNQQNAPARPTQQPELDLDNDFDDVLSALENPNAAPTSTPTPAAEPTVDDAPPPRAHARGRNKQKAVSTAVTTTPANHPISTTPAVASEGENGDESESFADESAAVLRSAKRRNRRWSMAAILASLLLGGASAYWLYGQPASLLEPDEVSTLENLGVPKHWIADSVGAAPAAAGPEGEAPEENGATIRLRPGSESLAFKPERDPAPEVVVAEPEKKLERFPGIPGPGGIKPGQVAKHEPNNARDARPKFGPNGEVEFGNAPRIANNGNGGKALIQPQGVPGNQPNNPNKVGGQQGMAPQGVILEGPGRAQPTIRRNNPPPPNTNIGRPPGGANPGGVNPKQKADELPQNMTSGPIGLGHGRAMARRSAAKEETKRVVPLDVEANVPNLLAQSPSLNSGFSVRQLEFDADNKLFLADGMKHFYLADWKNEDWFETTIDSAATTTTASLKASPDGNALVLSSDDGRVDIWDTSGDAPKFKFRFDGHTKRVNHIEFSDAGDIVVTGDEAGRIVSWQLADGKQLGVLDEFKSAIKSLEVKGTSVNIFATDGAKFVRGRAGSNSGKYLDIRIRQSRIWITPTGSKMATASGSKLKFYDRSSLQEVESFDAGEPVDDIKFGTEEKIVFVQSAGKISQWDWRSGRRIAQYDAAPGKQVKHFAISNDGKHLAFIQGTRDASDVRVFEVQEP